MAKQRPHNHNTPDRRTDSDPDPASQEDDIASASGLILPGGKVDARAIVDAAQRAREQGLEPGEDEELRRVRFELRHDLDKRLDKYLTDRITFLSRTQLQNLIDQGGVLVNGALPKASTRLHAGDVVEVVVPPPASKDIVPEDIPLDVLYEDDHLIVLNKQPGIIVHPARSHLTGTMLSALAFHFKHRSATGGELSAVGKDLARPGVVHRLDRDTSGCIVFAKRDEAHWKLGHQFEHRRVEKRYVALVHGRLEPDYGVIDLPIGPHPSREKGYREKWVVRHDELGKPSVTIYRVLERYAIKKPAQRSGPPSVAEFSLVEIELKTGRTHQIRVHCSYQGHPLVGDDMYGGLLLAPGDVGLTSAALLTLGVATDRASVNTGEQFDAKATAGEAVLIARQALHAGLLGFTHPITEQRMEFVAPLRGDLIALVRALRASGKSQALPSAGSRLALDVLVPSP